MNGWGWALVGFGVWVGGVVFLLAVLGVVACSNEDWDTAADEAYVSAVLAALEPR